MLLYRAFFSLFLVFAAVSVSSANDTVKIEKVWVRPAPANGTSAVFMVIKNAGKNPDRLVSASTDSAKIVELHDHIADGDVKRMRPVNGIDIPAGGEVILKPGGLHVMLFDLTRELIKNDKIHLILNFEKAGKVYLEVPIKNMKHKHKKKKKRCNCQCKVDEQQA